ncbi:MAG: hypothetical protein ACKVQK_13090 [Burkholderiales bacterium]
MLPVLPIILLGVLLIAIAVLTLSGVDKRIEALLLDVMPEWLVNLTTLF